MIQNNNKEVQYIWHDGATIKEDLLVTMAKRAGNMVIAEHNIISLYRHILIENGLGEYVKIENDIRSHYNAESVPMPDIDGVKAPHMPNKAEQAKNDKARAIYQKLDYVHRVALLNEGLNILMCNHEDVFTSAIDWSGIYLVAHDRLDPKVNRTSFYKLAVDSTPEGWPEELRIGLNTLSNFAHYVSYEDRREAYYDMDNNPWKVLCDEFWKVVRQLLLTKCLLNNG